MLYACRVVYPVASTVELRIPPYPFSPLRVVNNVKLRLTATFDMSPSSPKENKTTEYATPFKNVLFVTRLEFLRKAGGVVPY